MSEFTQDNRPLRITTPLGKDVLLLERIVGEETVSRPFLFRLDLLSERPDVAASAILGKPVTVQMDFAGGQTRFLNGIVSRFGQAGRDQRLVRYHAELVPKLWLGTLRERSKIYQQKTVPDILKLVLDELEVAHENKLQGTYQKRNYCAQYRESYQRFASRLMETEGIHFYHTHADGSHSLVLSDISQGAPACPGVARVRAHTAGTHPGASEDALVWNLTRDESVVSGKVVLWDYSFELPARNLEAQAAHGVAGYQQNEVYEYPGGYAHFDGIASGGGEQNGELQHVFDENDRISEVRLRERSIPETVLRGESNCPLLTAGHKVTVAEHYRSDFNTAYFLVSVRHEASIENYVNPAGSPFSYRSSFEAIPADRPFVPPRLTPRPRVDGSQTAKVVGPDGEEIFTDKYGRVKVQFNWDRDGQSNPASSCWVRVSTPSAGKMWGMISIPRIGNEVVVDFLEGDPDRPIITGMVYNADSMPPYALPDNRTRSVLKTRSTLDGTAENFNEIRIEDKKDQEQIYLHAERDLDAVVENNETRKIGFEKQEPGDQAIDVFNNRTVTIGAGGSDAGDGSDSLTIYNDHTITVEEGNQTIEVQKGDQTIHVVEGAQTVTVDQDRTVNVKQGNQIVTVDAGDDRLTVKQGKHQVQVETGNQEITIDTGNQTIKLGSGNRGVKVDLGSITEEAMQGIELKVGSNSIKIDQSGVTIKGINVKIEGQAAVQIKAAAMAQVDGGGMLVLKGGVAMIN
jgi:type VI secretion system secreted protein VgrG